MTSKSYRAVLPHLSEGDIERLLAWSTQFCAATAVYREDAGAVVVWVATKERARSREAFMRSVRSTLRHLGIAAMPRGRWLVLTDESVVRCEAAEHAERLPTADPSAPERTWHCAREPVGPRWEDDPDGAKVIALSGGPRLGHASCAAGGPLRVYKEGAESSAQGASQAAPLPSAVRSRQ
jgi:hypothetical protein